MRTSNPALNENAFNERLAVGEQRMTIQGAVNKTAILLVLATVFTWQKFRVNPAGAMPLVFGGAIGGFILGLVTVFKKTWAPMTAPIYALCEGLLIGGVSALYEAKFQGIVLQAGMLTFGTLFALLVAYRSGIIRATENF